MIKDHLIFDKNIELNGNKISYRSLPSYNMKFHNHEALQLLIPLDNANYEITWELEDNGTECKTLSVGDICIIPPFLGHAVRWVSCAHFVNIYIPLKYICEATDNIYDKDSDIFLEQIGIRDQFIFHLGQSLKQMFLMKKDGNIKYFDAVIILLSNYLVNNYMISSEEVEKNNVDSNSPCEKIRRSIMYMSNNINKNLSVEEIASEVGISQYHFIRLFRKQVGMSPVRYHMLQRIEKSKELLLEQEKIVDIAYNLGFSSQSHFSNAFLRSVGVTPLKFQQNN